MHSAASQNPFYTNFRVLADDLKRDVIFTNKNNNEIESMTDYNGYTTYAYDDWGRMSTETRGSASRTFAYVMGSKLASVSGTLGGSNSLYYGYAGDGKRNFRMLNGAVTASYRWDAGYNVVNEKNASGALARTYVVAPKPVTQAAPGVPMEGLLVNQGPVGITLAEVAGSNPATGAYKYYAHDNIQSTRGLFEQNKAVAGTIEYTPYGENYTSPAPTGLTHRFTGLDLDATTGQYYAPYRYYVPNLSRWLTRDPLGMVDGPNIYSYVKLDPIGWSDPLGLLTAADCKRIRDLDLLLCELLFKTAKAKLRCRGLALTAYAKCLAAAAWNRCKENLKPPPWWMIIPIG